MSKRRRSPLQVAIGKDMLVPGKFRRPALRASLPCLLQLTLTLKTLRWGVMGALLPQNCPCLLRDFRVLLSPPPGANLSTIFQSADFGNSIDSVSYETISGRQITQTGSPVFDPIQLSHGELPVFHNYVEKLSKWVRAFDNFSQSSFVLQLTHCDLD